MHSGNYAFRDRKQNKRNFRKLWITRINAGCRENEISYSKFISGLNKAGIEINRKMLAELAVNDSKSFKNIVDIAKDANAGKIKKVEKTETKAEVKKEEVVKEEVKKTPAKKTTTTKTTAKTTTKKPAAKKTTTTKTTAKKTTKASK